MRFLRRIFSGWRLYRSDLGDYMRRWILQTPFGTLRIHKILRSDDDRHFHDHPWNFVSFILKGRYVEITPCPCGRPPVCLTGDREERVYKAGQINRKRADALHILRLDHGPVWTFVVTGPRVRRWGFQTENGWV